MPMPSPAPFTLAKTAFAGGVWHGRLSTAAASASANASRPQPDLAVYLDGTRQTDPEVTAIPGTPGAWQVRWPVPSTALGDGISVFLIVEGAQQTLLARLPILAGDDLVDDLRAEVALLRAELDQLRGAFQAEARARTLDSTAED